MGKTVLVVGFVAVVAGCQEPGPQPATAAEAMNDPRFHPVQAPPPPSARPPAAATASPPPSPPPDPNRVRCDASRATRAAVAKQEARAWVAFLEHIIPAEEKIRKTCQVKDTTGVHVERERDRTGVTYRVRNVGAVDDVVCTGALPKGISKDDARALLTMETYQGNSIVDPDTQDYVCRPFDEEVGLNIYATYGDGDSIRSLLTWGDETKPR